MLRAVIRVEYLGKLAVIRVFLPTDSNGYIHSFLVSKEKLLGEELTKIWGINALECYEEYRTKAVLVEGKYSEVDEFVEKISEKLKRIAKSNGYEEELKVDIYIYIQPKTPKITL